MPTKATHSLHAQALQRARDHIEADRLVEAESIYRELIDAAPQFHPALSAYGLLAARTGRLPLAAELFEKALTLEPNEVFYCRNYGEICRRMGRTAEAIEAGTRACGLAPDDIDAHFNLALACSDANLSVRIDAIYEKVLKLLEPAIAADKASAAMWERRAFILLRMNRIEEARQSRERARNLAPDKPTLLGGLTELPASLLGDLGADAAGTQAFASTSHYA